MANAERGLEDRDRVKAIRLGSEIVGQLCARGTAPGRGGGIGGHGDCVSSLGVGDVSDNPTSYRADSTLNSMEPEKRQTTTAGPFTFYLIDFNV